jgi:RNA polymerase sigma factor (sigma-70 family)
MIGKLFFMTNHIYYRSSLDALMQEAGRHSVPTAKEEAAYVRAAKAGDVRATHNLVLGHLRLVLKIAHGLARNNRDLLEELAAAGVAGMIEAVGNYKMSSSRGGRFMHYAVFHVRRQMRRALNDFRTPVSANPNNYDIARKILAYEDAALKEGRRATHEEVGKKFGLTPNRVERMKKLLESPMYLDHAVNAEDERSGHDICADGSAANPAMMAETTTERAMLMEVMNAHLDEREVSILKRRFGVGYSDDADLHEIGEELNISRERVRQIEEAALKKLRFHLSQRCTTYKSRAAKLGNVAVAATKMKTPRVQNAMEAVAAKPIAKVAPKMMLVKTPARKVEVRELEECVA